ncbi:MAG: glycerophosphodiester phosphodiesterase family protein [Syntrophales bacterium]|nr:glycerophosphodiester phosphodiesterase family protein [Syntrophales bacterium]
MKTDIPGMRFFAHRGASGHEPENTLRAFRRALELGATWIETDVFAVEGELVVIHDAHLERTTDGHGVVADSSLAYLRRLDAGAGERIPLLREVLELIAGRAGINIELKGPGTPPLVASLIATFTTTGRMAGDDFLVSSFDRRLLRHFRRLSPSIPIGLLYRGYPRFYPRHAQELQASSLHIPQRVVTRPLVAEAHGHGLKVFVYTVNSHADVDRMVTMGVDGVFTDFPELAYRRGAALSLTGGADVR